MTKIVVFSDSHGIVSYMSDIVAQEKPDRVFHLGDVVQDAVRLGQIYPELPIDSVLGNCDWRGGAPLEKLVTVEGCTFFLCHGHTYYVKNGYHYLIERGRELKVTMALCGHTHRWYYDCVGSLIVLNPGTVGCGVETTYAVLTVNGATVNVARRCW